MLDAEVVSTQRELLATYRRSLTHWLQQAAQYGGEVFAPPVTANGVHEAREQIRRIKVFLRNHGVSVDDHPNDELPVLSSEQRISQTPIPRQIVGDVVLGDGVAGDKIGGDKLNAEAAQGIITNPAGSVHQTNINTGGGSSVQENSGVIQQVNASNGGSISAVVGSQYNTTNYYYRHSGSTTSKPQEPSIEAILPSANRRRMTIAIFLTGVFAVLGAIATSLATSRLPGTLGSFVWIAWPLVIVCGSVSIGLGIWQLRLHSVVSATRFTQPQRNRFVMLERVKTIWVKGLLEQSLAKMTRIELDLIDQPGFVDLPLYKQVQELNRPPQPIAPGTPMIDVFDQMNGGLLILGAPGAGKTTLLLELTRDLIKRAEHDQEHPIPIVFNLSSWAQHRTPLADWLIDELISRYDVPRTLGQIWVENRIVLPLLDGLDEVTAEYRAECVEAINAYRQTHGLGPIAVCSRIVDYEALSVKLRLQGAIRVQPLTAEQIDTYLLHDSETLTTVQEALQHDALLRRLVDTPLMLSIVILAYVGQPIERSRADETLEQRRQRMFNLYIQRMLSRRGRSASWTPEQTIHWLAWLAQGMSRQGQSIFQIERLQPDWLATRWRRIQYVLLDRVVGGLIASVCCALVAALLVGLTSAAIAWLYGGLEYGFWVGLAGGAIGALAGAGTGLLLGCLFGGSGRIRPWIRFHQEYTALMVKHSPIGGIVGIVFIFINVLAFWRRDFFQVIAGGMWLLYIGLLLGLDVRPRNISPAMSLRWSWSRFRSRTSIAFILVLMNIIVGDNEQNSTLNQISMGAVGLIGFASGLTLVRDDVKRDKKYRAEMISRFTGSTWNMR